MRGLAAFAVFVFHSLLTSPTFCAIVDGAAPRGGWQWALTYTPLHLAWAGDEAVSLFFVLSGFVLTLPYLQPNRERRWAPYYAARFVRLYLPAAASIAWASLSFVLVDHHAPASASRWLVGHDFALTPAIALHDMLLVDGAGYLNSVIWSLRWEVWFSVFLPLTILGLGWSARWHASLSVLTLLSLALCGILDIKSGGYVLTFAFGVLLAAQLEKISPWLARIPDERWRWIISAGVLLLLARWWSGVKVPIAPALVTTGAGLLMLSCLGSSRAARACQQPWVQWLGVRSFSFYLVHDPVVTCTALLLGKHNHPALVLLLALPISLAVTFGFFALVERPSHAAAKRAGRWLGRRDTVLTVPRSIELPTAGPAEFAGEAREAD